MRNLRKQSRAVLFFVCASVSASLSQNDSDWWTPFYHKGLKLIEQKQYEAAREQFKKILARDKKVAQAHYGFGLSYAAEKPDSRDALDHFNKATQIDKQYAKAYYQSGLVYANMKRYQNARKAFLTATRTVPTFVDAWLKLGENEARAGERGKVVEAYKNAVKNIPESEVLYDKLISAATLYHEEDQVIDFLAELSQKSDSLRRLPDVAYLSYIAGNLDKSMSIVSAIPPEKATAKIYLLQALFNFAREKDDEGLAYYWSAVNYIENEADAAAFFRDCAYIMRNEEYDALKKTPIPEVWRFYYRFWRSRDPNLGTDENERIPEHYRRLSQARKSYRRLTAKSDRQYRLEHPLRKEQFRPKVGSEMLNPYLSDALSENRDLDDMGLIFVRHGKPDHEVTYVDATDESLPQNMSWKYNRRWNHPEMIFHFAKWGGSHGWVLTSLPVTFAHRWELGGPYLQLDPERPEIEGLMQQDFVRLYDAVEQDNLEYARIGVQTETSNYHFEGVEPLDFPYQFVAFRGESGKLLLEIYYGLNGAETLLKSTEQGMALSLQEFFGLYDDEWNEAGKIHSENNLLVSATPEEWRNAGVVDMKRFEIAPGTYTYEIHIQDRTSDKMGIYRGKYNLENLWVQDSLLLSDVIVSGPILQAETAGKFVKTGIRYFPHMFSDFKAGEELGLYFEIYNLFCDAQGQTTFRITCTLQPIGGVTANSSNVIGFFKSLFDKDKEVISTSYDYAGHTPNEKIYMNVQLQGRRGSYELVVDIHDLQAQRTARKAIKIRIQG